MRKALFLGCGRRLQKDIWVDGFKGGIPEEEFEMKVGLDNNPDHNPNVLHDLTVHPLPFFDSEFDEIHAYDVLEHLAHQGDYKFFFSEFSEYWRILRPGGWFFATVPEPSSIWALGDPSHKRIITKENICFLSQDFYEQVGITKCSDFRYIYKANFKVLMSEYKNGNHSFILETIK